MTESRSQNLVWGDRPLPPRGHTECLQVGPLTLWLRRVENEVWLAYFRSNGDVPHESEPPGDAEWHRWAFRERPHKLRLVPALPDRVLVVGTEQPFTLLKGAQARIYMRVALWVRVEAVDEETGSATTLIEVPTELFSDTWWGDFREGEPAYWMTVRARREISDEIFRPDRVMAVLHLTNRAEQDLRVEKLALRVEHLSIYLDDRDRLWAEETRVDYRGEALGSDIHMDDQPPVEAKEAREITPARAQVRGFRARTFARLKALSGLGFGGSA